VSLRRWSPLVLGLVVVILLSSAPAAPAAPAGTPRLQLKAASSFVEIPRYGRGPVWLELGISLVSLDAPFELQVRRDTYDDPIGVSQVFHRPGGVELADLPAGILEGWTGLDRFLRIDLYKDGTLVRRKVPDACLGGWQTERVDDSGPFDPTYPTGCGFNPLTLGAVWGIDQGWSSTPLLWNGFVRLPDGRYVAKVSIAPRYQNLFGVAPADAEVRVVIRIRSRSGCDFCGAPAAPEGSAFRRALTPAAITADPDPATVPDLVALPAYGIGVSRERGRDYLQFGADVWNRGPAPLLVEGFRAAGEDRMDAYQYFTQDGVVVGRASVGSFHFDHRDGHQHWHFLQFARYRLLDAADVAIRSKKQAFCLAPTDPIDLTLDGAVWRPDEIGFSQCGSLTSTWIREVLPAGWGDTYFQGVPGQSFDITDLPNGSYWIEVRANPGHRLFDGDPANDAELREVILGGTPGHRTVSVPPWHGIDTEYFFGFGSGPGFGAAP
jgi:Lysyl oxidase